MKASAYAPTAPTVSVTLWCALAVLLVGLAYRGAHVGGDALLYIAHGRFMLEHGALPDVDPFSQASIHTRPLVLHMVLCMWLFAAIDATVGLAYVVPLTALVCAVALLAMIRLAGRGRAGGTDGHAGQQSAATFGALGFVALLVGIDKELFEVRGQAFAYLPLVLYLFVLRVLLDEPDDVKARRVLPLAFPLVAVWANVHPSFVIALALPILCAVALLVVERRRERSRWQLFAALAGIAVLGSFVSPYGPRLLLDVLSLLADPTTSKIEHMRSPPASFGFVAWLVLSLSLIFADALRGTRRMRRVRTLVALALVIATLMSRRYVVIATAFEIMLLGPLFARLLAPFAEKLRIRLVHVVVGVVSVGVGLALVHQGPNDLDEDQPNDMIVVLDSLDARGARAPDRVLTEFAWGGALMYAWGETRQVHIDGRNNLYANGVFDDYMRFIFDVDSAPALLDVYEINTVLWPLTWKLNDKLASMPQQWREVYRDEKAVLWVRR